MKIVSRDRTASLNPFQVVTLTDGAAALDDVLQFAHVAGEIVGLELYRQMTGAQAADPLPRLHLLAPVPGQSFEMKVDDDQVGDAHPSQALGLALALGSEVERLAENILSSLGLAQDDDEQLLMFSMSLRCIIFFRAVLCLAQAQLAQPTAACVRSLIEQRWVFEAVARESTRKEAIHWLWQHGEYNRKRCVDNLRQQGQDGRDQRITDEWLAEVEAGIHPERKHHSQNSWADLAGRTSEYLMAYALLCDQTHPSSRAVENHLLCDADGRVLSVTAKADFESLPMHMTQACEVMIDVIAACPQSWLTDDIISQATDLRQRLSELWKRVPDLLPLTP